MKKKIVYSARATKARNTRIITSIGETKLRIIGFVDFAFQSVSELDNTTNILRISVMFRSLLWFYKNECKAQSNALKTQRFDPPIQCFHQG